MSERITRRVIVHGRVQGVGFREFMRREAVRHGVAGWVRNRRDGSVEAMIHGDRAGVEALVAWAGQGPPSAQVTQVDIDEADASFDAFEVRRTE